RASVPSHVASSSPAMVHSRSFMVANVPVQTPVAQAAALVHTSPSSTVHAVPLAAAWQSALQQPVAPATPGSQLSPASTVPFPQRAIARTPPVPKVLSVPNGTNTVSPWTTGRPTTGAGTA